MLQIKALSKTFNSNTINENKLFNEFNLHVQKGDFITIIGSNGAGKSTLLNLISGSIKSDRGSILLENQELCSTPEYKRSKLIGRVFQDPSCGTASNMTILQNMSMAYNKGKSFGLSMGISKSNIDLFKDMLSKLDMGLEDKLYSKVGLLSGGQRQALSLIMAVMSKPQLLLLDEHTAALDPKTSERIIEITEKIVNENNITTLMVTHNLNHAIRLGNRLLMMNDGKIIMDFCHEEKKTLNTQKLLKCFENLQSDEVLSDRILFS